MQIFPILALAAGGYFLYTVLSAEYGDPLEQAAESIPNQDFYTSDATSVDQALELTAPGAGPVTVKTIDPGAIYNIDMGVGVNFQVNQDGLQSLRDARPSQKFIVK